MFSQSTVKELNVGIEHLTLNAACKRTVRINVQIRPVEGGLLHIWLTSCHRASEAEDAELFPGQRGARQAINSALFAFTALPNDRDLEGLSKYVLQHLLSV